MLKHALLTIALGLTACAKKDVDEQTPKADSRVGELRQAYDGALAEALELRNSTTGWLDQSCDGAKRTGLYAASPGVTGVVMGLAEYPDEPGRWHRRPLSTPCWTKEAGDVGSVDARRRRFHVVDSKNGEDREVPIPQFVLDLLDLDRAPSEPLFLSPLGLRVNVRNFRRRVFYPAVKASGLGVVKPHDMRHTASLAIAEGADLKAVQTMLGHKSGKMTYDLYGHLFDEALDNVADRLDKAYRRDVSRYVSGTPDDGGVGVG